ncbi:MAG: M48 family metallopeptidase [Fibrobacteres bacterium]|nr:M48 family metallopeptidase [Fibrobacterota bacterium]
MKYQGRYFNGESALGFPAEISLLDTCIRIEYLESDVAVTVDWAVSEIHKVENLSKNELILFYGKYPVHSLKFDDFSAFDALKNTYGSASFLKSPYQKILQLKLSAILVITSILIGLIVLSYIFLLPIIAEKASVKMPPSVESYLGEGLNAKLLSQFELDSVKTAAAQEIVDNLKLEGDDPLTVYIVKSNDKNAFAIPGGSIFIYDSLIYSMNSCSTFVALVGHEYAHIYLRHTVRTLIRSLSSYLLLTFLFGDATGLSAAIVQNADLLKSLEYNRDLESAADSFAVEFLVKNGFSGRHMGELLETFKSEKGIKVWEIISTHPDVQSRIDALKVHSNSIPNQDITSEIDLKLWDIVRREN